ncbi:MAG TPA: DUF308 domain-containing protein [Marmoricola sp.]|nr:DUF308 domain-containing protein [Nocardioidaceae bacterium]MCO5324332.1 DUF308 domain-containing protein [Nocardioidaceae bacterium]HMU35624.1 DUF308 domain-containing protein [Marmoricola sp.]HMY08496.1 DUF308 domain-containing protein [Marmoricola sp.]HRV68073.1 DUF308 domain-containing protein [Marmoricola sp.]
MPKDWLEISWKLLLARGGIGIIFGAGAMIWPAKTLVVLAIFWGLWALVDGLGTLVQIFATGTPPAARFLAALLGVVSVIAAVVAISSPTFAVTAVTWVLGLWLIARGIAELIGAISITNAHGKILLAIGGALDIAIGVLFMSNPGRSALAVAFIVGLLALIWGLILVASGIALRAQVKNINLRSQIA